ncbi:MAG TPA: choice-of-anchor Q domain-containing protein [Puia sp.]|nr:choice-of-anchor Q domain-containing protein [Puia sp.]
MSKNLLFFIFAVFALVSCQKQSNLNGNAYLFLSADTVRFDTVFTSTGSVTQQVKLINNNNHGIGISSISLAGGSGSPFIINIDGTPGPSATNLNIQSNDSLYIFVTVLIPLGAKPTPFLLQDSIRISYNGIEQYIQLTAWGQNAHFLKNMVIQGNTTWANDLPYVIYGGLTIDSNAILTIQAGTHIYMHADAPIYIDGSLKVMGDTSENHRVYFTGDRLDQPYVNYPGSWPGIYFRNSSRDNVLNFAIFQNGYHSLVAEGPSIDMNPKLSLNQCIINNSLAEGVLGIQSSITAINCLISNCGQNIVIGLGGVYQFEYCTVASYSTNLLSHLQPVLTISNASSDGTQILTGDLNAGFLNCIFWGSESITDEALISKQGNTVFKVLFDHSILKQQNYPANIDSNALWLNTDPQFLATGFPGTTFDFHVEATSPAVDHGSNLGILIDLDGNPRPVNLPDLGCYERQ